MLSTFSLEVGYPLTMNASECPYCLKRSCTLEFDGASKGNPGQAGAGVILRADDGSLSCRLREGLGIVTCNAAEYRAIILGLKYALDKGFSSIRVRGDSKLVCMQIFHVLRDSNSEADEQANLAVELAEGQIQEEIDK